MESYVLYYDNRISHCSSVRPGCNDIGHINNVGVMSIMGQK